MPCVPACQRALRANLVYVQRACVPTCQKRASFLFLRANVPITVPTCHKACQCFNLPCQGAKRRVKFSTWRANVPKSVPIFQKFLLQNAKVNFYNSLLYKKFCIVLDIIVIHIIFISRMYTYRTWKLYYALFLYFMSYWRKVCKIFAFWIFFALSL